MIISRITLYCIHCTIIIVVVAAVIIIIVICSPGIPLIAFFFIFNF